jgi:hypothetical protein
MKIIKLKILILNNKVKLILNKNKRKLFYPLEKKELFLISEMILFINKFLLIIILINLINSIMISKIY